MSECPHCKSHNIHLSMATGGRDHVMLIYDCRNCWRTFESKWERGKEITVTERKSTPSARGASPRGDVFGTAE